MILTEGSGRTAKRIDEDRGIVEEAGFVGDGPQRVFGVLHAPVEPPTQGVVICPAVSAESLTTYSNDVVMARELAAHGIAAFRFHYRGSGHSDGHDDEMTFETMKEDALTAATEISSRLGVDETAFLGTRFTGIVAAAAATEYPGAPVALWEPVLAGRAYFKEAWRARAIFGIKEGAPQAGKSLPDVLANEGVLDLLGYPIFPTFYESALERTLLDELGTAGRPVLLVHGQSGSARSEQLEVTASTLGERGFAVDIEALSFPVVWWYLGPTHIREAQRDAAEIVQRTRAWFERVEWAP